MGLLQSLQQIQPPTIQKIETPEWTAANITHVFVRAGTANRRDAMESFWLDRKGSDRSGFRAVVAAFYLCDEAGTWAFDVRDVADAVVALGNQDARPVQRIFDAAAKLNSFTPEDESELVKN